jgi:phage portal protein, HK97 family
MAGSTNVALSLTNPGGWRRLWGWMTGGLWNPDKGIQRAGPPMGMNTASGVEVSDSRAMQISTVFSCIRLLAEVCAAMPLPVYKRLGDGTREEAGDHWLAKLLREPNPIMTGNQLREAVVASIAGWGNAYLEINRNADGRPVELWPLNPGGMQVTRTTPYTVAYKYTRQGDQIVEFPNAKVLHIRGFGADGFVGVSPLAMARESLGLAVAADQYAASFYANGGRPSGTMSIDKLLQPNQREQIREQFGAMAGAGPGAGARLWLLEAGMKYDAISIAPEDAQLLQTRQLQVSEIARYFRVPLFLLMEMEKSTSWGTGLEQQNLAFLTYTLAPYLTRIERSIGRWLLTDAERQEYYCEHNVEGLLRADSKARAEFLASMVQNGLMTRNEARGKENLSRAKGADDLTAQTNLAPLVLLGKQGLITNPPAP